MIRKQPRYTEEFQRAVVEAVHKGEKVAEVAQAHGISPGSVHNWLKRFTKVTPDRKSPIKTRRQFSDREKENAVELVEEGTPVMEVADLIGATPRSIYDWMQQLRPEQYRADQVAGRVEAALAERRLREAQEQKLEAERKMVHEEADRVRAEAEEAQRVREMTARPLKWMREFTKTKDSHWREAGADSPFRRLPDKPYFPPLAVAFEEAPVMFVEKSRDLMLSWLTVGLFTHAAMTTPGREVLFQSQKLEKACELVEYARTLYEQSDQAIRKAYPLAKSVQATGVLEFDNGSRIVAIPGGADQIRSYHPWGLLMDEAAFMPEATDCYNNAVPVCAKIVVLSSAGPGWFADVCTSAVLDKELVRGLLRKKAGQGWVFRVHYSADPERDPALHSTWMEEERKKYSSESKWQREQEIIHEAGGGERLFVAALSKYEEKILIDPKTSGFQPSPSWRLTGGFDHGKANPTAALIAAVDGDGVLYILGEYYQPGLSPKQHVPHLGDLHGFLKAGEVYADPSIFHKNHAQADGSFKAVVELYQEEGITNLIRALDNNEQTGMERILKHWVNLDDRLPKLRIVCPTDLRDISQPIYGVHNEGCPNLLWELKRARREELSAGQLVNRNPSERIVDKDNHLRDCLKYMLSACVEPGKPTPEQKANEFIQHIPKDDPTSRMIWWQIACDDAKAADSAPLIPMGARGRYNLARYNRWKNRRNRNLSRDPS